MKKITLLFFLTAYIVTAQTVYFDEDFESPTPITSIRNADGSTGMFIEDQLPDGPPDCGYISRGDAAELNSTDVDYKTAENDTQFLNLNPQVKCGGYYIGTVRSEILDLSTATGNLYISGRYYVTSTLNFGMVNYAIGLYNGTEELIFDSTQMLERDSWTDFEFVIPSTFLTNTVVIGIGVTGGEAVGFDDLIVSDYSVLSTTTNYLSNIELFPNPVLDGKIHLSNNNKVDVEIFDLLGKKIKEFKSISNQLDISDINNGVYLVRLNDGNSSTIRKIIKN